MKRVPDLGYELHSKEGMTAEFEEILTDTDRALPQDALPDPREAQFGGVARV